MHMRAAPDPSRPADASSVTLADEHQAKIHLKHNSAADPGASPAQGLASCRQLKAQHTARKQQREPSLSSDFGGEGAASAGFASQQRECPVAEHQASVVVFKEAEVFRILGNVGPMALLA